MFKTTIAFFFFPLFFLLWPIKHKAGHVACILIKLSYLVPCYYSLLLESGINCTQWSHRREKSLRINIDSGMHLFAGFVSEEEGFPRENGGGPEVPALGRQPWVALGKDELSGDLVPQWGHPSPIQLAFSMGILQEKPVLRLWLDPPQSRGAGAARPPARRTAENIGPEAFCWRLGVPRRAPGRTRSPAGGARSARAAGPCCWGRRCSPRVRT